MFAELPAGSHLGKHRDPYAGSVRYHLGLVTPNDDRCFIEVDRQRHSWRDGQAVILMKPTCTGHRMKVSKRVSFYSAILSVL